MKKLNLAFLLLLLLFTLTGCFEKRELEDLAYVIAVGIDVGEKEKYSITYQIAVPIKIAGEGNDSAGKGSTTLITLETESLFNSISKVDSLISKELTLSHNKIIVCSEEIAKKGLDEILISFITDREVRPKTSIIIHKGNVKDFLANLEPILEKNPARYYDLLLASSEYTGYSIDNSLFHFFLSTQDKFSNAFAMLTENPTGENKETSIENKSGDNSGQKSSKENAEVKEIQNSSQNHESSNSEKKSSQDENTFDKENTSSQANDSSSQNSSDEKNSNQEIPKTANFAGIAVFKDDVMVGEIRDEQIISHLILQGHLKKVNVNIQDIKDKNKITVVKLSQTQAPKIQVSITDHVPDIKINVLLHAELITSGSAINYSENENRNKLGKAIQEKIKKDLKEYLEKISREYKTDIIGFGKYARTTVLTLKELDQIHWEKIFPKSKFQIDVRIQLDTTQMVTNELTS